MMIGHLDEEDGEEDQGEAEPDEDDKGEGSEGSEEKEDLIAEMKEKIKDTKASTGL